MPEADTNRDSNDNAGVRIPPPLIFAAGFLIGVAIEQAAPISDPPAVVRWLGAIAGAGTWLALDGAAMLTFGRAKTSPNPSRPAAALITTGPYRVTRNPMYLGMSGLHAGLALALGFLWALALLPVVVLVFDRLVVPREEAYLRRRFGRDYREYAQRVRRWV